MKRPIGAELLLGVENMSKALDAFDRATWSEDERYYFETVDEALASGADVAISNGRPQHAVYLIEKFFRNAERVVRLFSGRLSRTYGGVSVYSNPRVIAAAEHLVGRPDCKLSVVIQEEIDVSHGQSVADHPLARMASGLKDKGNLHGLLEIRQASRDAIDFLRGRNYCHHWMVMDQRAYRLETDTEQVKAHVNFGDSITVGALTTIFDHLLYRTGKDLIKIGG